jgi:hypothetical protein
VHCILPVYLHPQLYPKHVTTAPRVQPCPQVTLATCQCSNLLPVVLHSRS